MKKKIIAIIGNSQAAPDSVNYKTAYAIGKLAIEAGFRIQCGGLSGVMEAACKGASESPMHKDGDIIGILPSFDYKIANDYVDIPIATGLDLYRNVIVANAQAVIMVGGGSGSLAELSNAWALRKLIIAMENTAGWASKVANTKLDDRKRMDGFIENDMIYGAKTPEEAIALIKKYIDIYDVAYTGITKHN